MMVCPPPPVLHCEQPLSPTATPFACTLADGTAVEVSVESDNGAISAKVRFPDGMTVAVDPAKRAEELSPFFRDLLHVPACPDA